MAIGEDATVQALPDMIAQVLGARQIPAAETAYHFNVQTSQHIMRMRSWIPTSTCCRAFQR